VAYLTGTRQLAERVEEEAVALGLDTVRFASRDYGGAKLDGYHQAQAVGVMNYWVYINSRPVSQPADLVIFDDAHLAEQPLSGLQTLRIPDTSQAPRASFIRRSASYIASGTPVKDSVDPPEVLNPRRSSHDVRAPQKRKCDHLTVRCINLG
jgi:hypothetical protein